MNAAAFSDSPLLSPDIAETIGNRAADLSMRLKYTAQPILRSPSGDLMPPPGTTNPQHQARWEMWQAESAGGDPALFRKRLDWDDIAPESALSVLDPEWSPVVPHLPDWLSFYDSFDNEGNAAFEAISGTVMGRCTAPFAPAFRPFLLESLTILYPDGAPEEDGNSAPAVLHGALESLLQELCKVAAPVLLKQFQEYLVSHGAVPDSANSRHYDAFTEELGTGSAWTPLLEAYPVLAALGARLCLGWAHDLRDFFARLTTDHAAICEHFKIPIGPGGTLPRLTNLLSGFSDRHQGAGTVKILHFSNGGRCVYKRRPLDLEADYHEMLRSLKQHGLSCAPPALRVLPRSGYGWVEYAEAQPLCSPPALDPYFQAAGSLLCLMHLLGGNDGHMENVIATADGPVLIDVETLLQPGALTSGKSAGGGTFSEAARRLQDSVLQTGLLPLWQRGRQGLLYDIGGLTGRGGYESPAPRQAWEGIGTDGIGTRWERRITRGLDNLPVLDGKRHSATTHLPSLCAGFAATWRFVQEHSSLVRNVLGGWKSAPLRVLLRPTTQYAALLERSLGVDVLTNGIDRSLVFEALRRPFIKAHAVRPLPWPAVDWEIRALEHGDIPLFFVRADGRDLEDPDGRIIVRNAWEQSALQTCLSRLAALDESGLKQQMERIAAAFIPPAASGTSNVPAPESKPEYIDYDALLKNTELISDAGLIRTAGILGDQIIQSAIRGRDGFVTWISPASLQPDQRDQRGVSYYLYDGAAGMALFLAALARATDSEPAKTTALAALEPIKAILNAPNAAAMISREGIGGCSGLGSLIYTLTSISGLLDAPELLERAERLSQLIDRPRIAADQALDIVGGSAGTIPALLALHRSGAAPGALQRAIWCGEHLLSKAQRVGADGLAWPSWPDQLLLAGYSHGTAGIASSLQALAAASGEERFAAAAMGALRYERSLLDLSAGNWPVLLPGGKSRMACTWCHGAPGILLSRTGFAADPEHAQDPVLHGEVLTARSTTLAAGLSAIDHLCCGTMGRVAILQDTAGLLPSGREMDLARLGATLTIKRAQQRKAFSLQPDPVRNSVFQPGFFRGTSGIGYTLLRLARPDLIPSVLLWETAATSPA